MELIIGREGKRLIIGREDMMLVSRSKTLYIKG